MKKIYSLLLICASLFAPFSYAKIYQYTNEAGKRIYVDQLLKVPQKYREQVTVHKEQRDVLSPKVMAEKEEARQQKRQDLSLSQQKRRLEAELKHWITPVRMIHNRIEVPVKIVFGTRSTKLTLVLDTGASSTVMYRKALQKVRVPIRSGQRTARVADGSQVKTQQASLTRMEIGPYKINNFMVNVIDFSGVPIGTQGLLGMDILSNTEYKLDKKGSRIIWNPEKYNQLKKQLDKMNNMPEPEVEQVMDAETVVEPKL